MAEIPKSLQEFLAGLGISEESIKQYKFGGIVGKVALIAIAGLAAAAGIAKLTSGYVQAICVVTVLATVLFIVRWIFDYAEKHPQSATLEGTQIIAWQQQQILLAAQGVTPPKDARLIASPLTDEIESDHSG